MPPAPRESWAWPPAERQGGLRIAERPADGEDPEPDPREEKGDPDHDPEQADLGGHVAHVERVRERGLADPDLPGAVLHRLLGRRIDRGELGVARCRRRHPAATSASRASPGRCPSARTCSHRVASSAWMCMYCAIACASAPVSIVWLAMLHRRPLLDRRGDARLLRLGLDRRRRHVGSRDDVLVREAVVDGVPAVHAHHDGDDAEHDEDGRCDEPSDLQCLAHVPTPFEPSFVSA